MNKDGTVEVHDSPTCMDKLSEPECGFCQHLISNNPSYIGTHFIFEHGHIRALKSGEKNWPQLRAHAVVLPAKESFAPLKAYAVSVCKSMNCDKTISDWKIKLDSLDSVGAAFPGGK